MSQEKFWVLLSKKLSAEASMAELKELEKLIHEHPEWQYAIQNLEDLWKHQPQKEFLQEEEDAFMLHLHRMTELNVSLENASPETPSIAPTRKIKRWYWAAAAAILLAGSLFIFAGRSSNASGGDIALNKEENEISTRPGSKSRVQLPDGTVVMLNAGSKLTYNKDFGQGTREVNLIGEGFFDVKKMKETPFIIHTASINIKVLGTVFNVRAYPEDKRTETSLIHGSIEVTIKNRPNDKIILSPSEKLVVENSIVKTKEDSPAPVKDETSVNPLMSVTKLNYSALDSSVAETQWIDNKLVFRDESFDELVLRMERWYDVSIAIRDSKLSQQRMTGSFHKETIEQALEALRISIPFRYEKTGNKIIIHR